MVEQRSPKPLMRVQLLLSVPYDLIAQQVEQRTETSCDAGSIPAETTIFLTINCLYGNFRHATVFLIFQE